jgi:putative transposase
MVKPTDRRQAVGSIQASYEFSERRACRALGFSRSSHRYASRRQEPAELLERLRAHAASRPRFGYRRLHLLLRRDGEQVNHKRVYRLYCLEGLSVRTKRRKRMVAAPRTVLPPPTRPNQRWSMDFVSDVTEKSRRFRVLTLVDDFTRRCMALVVDTSFSGKRIGRVLDELAAVHRLPQTIVVDNGPEFTSNALDQWAYQRGAKLHFIRPGKPVENAYIESFNGKFRDECLNSNWFADLLHARSVIEAWRVDYNDVRPHSSLDGLAPSEYEANFNQRGLPLRMV